MTDLASLITKAAETETMGVKRPTNMYLACLGPYVAALSFGYMIGYSSPAIPSMQQLGVLEDHHVSWFGSLSSVGAMIGCVAGGMLVGYLGRKSALVACAMPFLAGWLLIAASADTMLLMLGRLLTGVASGMVTVAAPTYISEIAKKEQRGMLGSGVQLSITLGILAVNALGLSYDYTKLAYIGFTLPVIGALLTFRLPETPRYLLIHGRRQEALQVLHWLNPDILKGDLEMECLDIEEGIDANQVISLAEMMKPELLRPLKVAIGLMVFQQLSGINVVMFYTVSIFEMAGYKENGTYAAVVIGVVQVIFTLVACYMMDRAGRRYLLLLAGFGMAVANIILAVFFYTQEHYPGSEIGWLALASLIVYIVAFSLGWGPIPMLVMSEIFPSHARGHASAITTVCGWTFSFLVTKEFSTVQLYAGPHGAFLFFGLSCLLSISFVYKMVPETNGKSLEDIELYFLGRAM